jgi:hypothetical protein
MAELPAGEIPQNPAFKKSKKSKGKKFKEPITWTSEDLKKIGKKFKIRSTVTVA